MMSLLSQVSFTDGCYMETVFLWPNLLFGGYAGLQLLWAAFLPAF
jgi:hypothetical protein